MVKGNTETVAFGFALAAENLILQDLLPSDRDRGGVDILRLAVLAGSRQQDANTMVRQTAEALTNV